LYYKKMVKGLQSLKAPTKVYWLLIRETTQEQHLEEKLLESLMQTTTCSFEHLWTCEPRIQQWKKVPNHFHWWF
jgi:hypothetical protein